MSEEKAAKSFIEASYHRLFSPYAFANLVKMEGGIPADALHKVALGWFRLMEIDHRYGIGDPAAGEIGSRIVHEVLSDYEELPEYRAFRGFENPVPDRSKTWEQYELPFPPSFVRKGDV